MMNQSIVTSPVAAAIVAANNDLALQLYRHISPEQENLIVCPISLNILLALILSGARSDTADEIRPVLHQSKDDDSTETYQKVLTDFNKSTQDFTLQILNKLYIDQSYSIIDKYRDIVTKHHSEIENVNLLDSPNESLEKINKWIQSKTNNTIKKAIETVNENDVMVLINTVYFAAKWENEFRVTRYPIEFHVTKESIVEVPEMFRRDAFDFYEDNEVQVLKIPYIDREYNMVILLPRRERELKDVEMELLEKVVKGYFESKMENDIVKVTLPLFKVEQSHQLNSILNKMGIEKAFSNEADLSGISDDINTPLKIGDVLQKAYIEVTDKGTVASAATPGMIAMRLSMTKLFHADRPFLFYIQHDPSKTILYLGRYQNPTVFYQKPN